MKTPSIRVDIDIGATFTDLQILDEVSGAVFSLKTPTTPGDPLVGLMNGLSGAASRFGFDIGAIRYLLHGTTNATNAVLEHKLAHGLLVTTDGFRDVLEIGRHARRDIYGLRPRREPPLIPRDRRFGVGEWVRADGSVERVLDPSTLEPVLACIRAHAIETVAVSLLNANANPAYEQRVRDLLLAEFPEVAVSISSGLNPEIREYERTTTTALNALLVPTVRSYLTRLADRLVDGGVKGRLLLVQSNGGVCSAEVASAQPVRLLLSGPSGGAKAAQQTACAINLANLIGLDMGGTSFDVCVVRGGEVAVMTQGEISGLPVHLPMVEIRTVGSGAGLAGALYAFYIQLVTPAIGWSGNSALIIAMAVLGGLGSIWGPFLGAILLFGLTEALRFVGVVYNPVAVGIVLMTFAIFLPKEIVGVRFGRRKRLLRADARAGGSGPDV